MRTTRFEMVTKKAFNTFKTRYPSIASKLRSDNKTARILYNNHTLLKYEITPNSNNPQWNKQICTTNHIDHIALNSEINEEFPSDANTEWV